MRRRPREPEGYQQAACQQRAAEFSMEDWNPYHGGLSGKKVKICSTI
jgi:hypothetical protein